MSYCGIEVETTSTRTTPGICTLRRQCNGRYDEQGRTTNEPCLLRTLGMNGSKVETSIVNTAPGFGELSARNTERRQWSGACDTASKQFTPLGYFLYLIKESRPTT